MVGELCQSCRLHKEASKQHGKPQWRWPPSAHDSVGGPMCTAVCATASANARVRTRAHSETHARAQTRVLAVLTQSTTSTKVILPRTAEARCARGLSSPLSSPCSPGPRRGKDKRPKRNPAVVASNVHDRSRVTGAREENEPRPAKGDRKKTPRSTESVAVSESASVCASLSRSPLLPKPFDGKREKRATPNKCQIHRRRPPRPLRAL